MLTNLYIITHTWGSSYAIRHSPPEPWATLFSFEPGEEKEGANFQRHIPTYGIRPTTSRKMVEGPLAHIS